MGRSSQSKAVRGARGLLFGLTACPLFGQSDTGTFSVAIRDKASGEVVPAMICITSLADHTWRMPPDGQLPAPYVTNGSHVHPE